MKTLLITGFEPFGGEKVNPALEAVKRLDGHQLNGAKIVTCAVPVVLQRSIDVVAKAIETHQPDYVVAVGQAGGRAAITPERVAINLDDYRIPDNDGNQPIDKKVAEDGADAYFSTLPIKAMVKVMQDNGIPAQVSNTAGTYVCNHLFYGIQYYLRKTNINSGFIHIPLMTSQCIDGKQPSMSLDTIVEGLILSAQAIVDNEYDINIGAGTIC